MASKIETNIISLQSILNKVNALPEEEDLTELLDEQEVKLNALMSALEGKSIGGGSGGNVQTCTVICNKAPLHIKLFYLDDESGNLCQISLSPSIILPQNRLILCVTNQYDGISTLSFSQSTNVEEKWHYADSYNAVILSLFILTDDTAKFVFVNNG